MLDSSFNHGINFIHSTTNKMLIYNASSSYKYSVATASSWLVGDWHYVEAKYRSSDNYFYIGVDTVDKTATGAVSGTPEGINSTFLAFRTFDGTVGNLLMYEKVLTTEESLQNYEALKHRWQ